MFPLYHEVYKKEINSLKDTSEKNGSDSSSQIKSRITEAYAKDQIDDVHYDLLREMISDRENNGHTKVRYMMPALELLNGWIIGFTLGEGSVQFNLDLWIEKLTP